MQHDDPFASVIEHISRILNNSVQPGSVPAAQLDDLATQFVHIWRAFEHQADTEAARNLGAQFADTGISVQTLNQCGHMIRTAADQRTPGAATVEALWRYTGDVMTGYVERTKRAAQEATIAEMQATQQREDQLRAVIQELSTPIIPIYRGVLVLPLVGAIDSMRSQEITERLLEEIVRQQADMVIIDITGVSVVDTSVANHLIMTAQAVNLLGSKVIFTGISSMIAQTIIQLGVTLGDVVTLSNLQAGMSYALEQLGLGITELAYS